MLLKKAKSLVLAIWSFLRWGDVTVSEYQKRQTVCHDCARFLVSQRGMFCDACGCLPSPVSDLRTKWRLPDLKCPLDKW